MEEKQIQNNELYESCFHYKERRSTLRFVIVLLSVLFVVLCFRAYFSVNFGGVIVDGASMNKTLYNGEELLMRRTDEKYKAKRGDIIVVNVSAYPECRGVESGFLIKRLIATAGDKVQCIDGEVYVWYAGEEGYRDKPIDEPYAYYTDKQSYDFAEYEVQEGEVFFLGDNRNNSKDSRYQEGHSSLKNRLYKEEDIYGVVPTWAVKNQKLLSKIFFPNNPLKNVKKR